MNLVDAGNFADAIDGLQWTELQVVVPCEVLCLSDSATPRYQKDLVTLSDRILDERILFSEIEQIVFVDAWRDNQKLHVLRFWSVLNQLDELIFEDHRSRRYRKIATNFECCFVDPRNAPLLNVFDEVLHTGNQTSETALDGRSDHGRIRKREVRWTHRINELPGEKSKLKLRFFIHLSVLNEVIQLLRAQQIGLLH